MGVIHLTVNDFEKEVINSDKPVLVDFWASWCGPCKMLSPIVEELGEELSEVKVCKVNVDEQGELAQRFRIMTIPSLLIFKDGNLVNTSVGVKPKTEILDMRKFE